MNRRYFIYAKFLLVPVILWFLFKSFLRDDNFDLFRSANHLLALAIILNQAALALFAWRLGLLTGIYGMFLRPVTAFKIHVQSVFYQVFSPMSVGMELARFVKVRNLHPGSTKTVLITALLSDRVWSLVATLITILAFLPFVSFEGFPAVRAGREIIIGLSVVMIVVAVMTLRAARVRELLQKLTRAVLQQRSHVFRLLLLSLVTHMTSIAAIYYFVTALDLRVGMMECQFGISLSMLFLVVPVSFLGITLTEVASFGVFAALGYPREEAVVVATCVYALRTFGAFQGGLWEFIEDGYRIRAIQKKP